MAKLYKEYANFLRFATKAEAVAYLDARPELEFFKGKNPFYRYYKHNRDYLLQPGEYGPPIYYPKKYSKDRGKKWGIEVETFSYKPILTFLRLYESKVGELKGGVYLTIRKRVKMSKTILIAPGIEVFSHTITTALDDNGERGDYRQELFAGRLVTNSEEDLKTWVFWLSTNGNPLYVGWYNPNVDNKIDTEEADCFFIDDVEEGDEGFAEAWLSREKLNIWADANALAERSTENE
jgi:hypothetical protein